MLHDCHRAVRVAAQRFAQGGQCQLQAVDGLNLPRLGRIEKNGEFQRLYRAVWHKQPPKTASYGSFERSIALPAEADESHAKAEYKKGVLRLTFPKRADAQSRRKTIPVT